jgi:hypothetical protein
MDTNSHVLEETSGIVCGNRSEGLRKRIDRARSRFTQVIVDFGPSSFKMFEKEIHFH